MPIYKVIYQTNEQYGGKKYHDDSALADVIDYCLDSVKTPHHYTGGFGLNINQAPLEMELLADAYGQTKGLRLRHFILSFSQDEVLGFQPYVFETLYDIARCAANYYGNEYQIIFSVHEDSSETHVHFVMNTVNFLTGKKYRGDKADYYAFQKYLKEILREYDLTLRVAPDDKA